MCIPVERVCVHIFVLHAFLPKYIVIATVDLCMHVLACSCACSIYICAYIYIYTHIHTQQVPHLGPVTLTVRAREQLYRLDLSANPPTWTLVKITGPSPRHGHAMALKDHKAYLFGGSDGDNVLLADLWVLKVPDAQKAEGAQAMQWTQILIEDSHLVGRTGHRLVAFGSNILLMGGAFDVSMTPDKSVHVLQVTDSTIDLKWSAHPIFTPGALSEYQAVAAIGSIVYVFGGSIMGTVTDAGSALRSAEALPWYTPRNTDRMECYRTKHTPQRGMCAGRAMIVSSCETSFQKVITKYASREASYLIFTVHNETDARHETNGTVETNATASVGNETNETLLISGPGPRWFQTKDECVQDLTAMCLRLGADTNGEAPSCNEDFLCKADSLYTSWSLDPGI
jgi:hypothetical protein